MADPMGDEAAYVLAAHLQHGIEGHGHEEILLLVPDRDDTTMATANNKRTAADAMLEQEVTYEEDDSRKKRRGSPPQKKLNNEQWDAMFARLVEYKRLNGDCLVPKRYAQDPKLGTWVETQRIQWKKLPRTLAEGDMEVVTPNRRLNDERLKRLQSIGFAWSAKNVRKPKPASPEEPMVARARKSNIPTDPVSRAAARQQENDRQWMYMYDRLVEYKNKHGDCLVPKKYPEDPKLGSWVEAQRNLFNREYKQKADSGSSSNEDAPPPPPAAAAASMPPTYAKSPEEWADEMEITATNAAADSAMAMNISGGGVEAAAMEVVNEMTADDGGGKRAAIDNETELPGEYMDEKLPPKRLSEDRKKMLDSLGFVWSLRSKRTDDHWDDMYRQLVEYKAKHGDCLVPSRYEENFKLGKWVETQRYEFTKLQRATGRKSEQNLESPVEQQQSEEGKGGKKSRANPRLTEERLRRLEAIGFEWKVKNKMKRYYDRQWDGMFEKLLKFKEENGHCLVPKRYDADLKLGTWVHTQRIQYRKLLSGNAKKEASHEAFEGEASEKSDEEKNFRLTEDRRRRLDEIGFVWSARESDKAIESVKSSRNSYDDQWDTMFERLRAYKEVHGNCLVPKRYKDDPKLGTWVDTQRVQRKKMLKHMTAVELRNEDPSAADSFVPIKSRGRLTAERMEKLESLGFVWSLRDDWHKHYMELKAYKEQHGHCNVPARYAENRKLGIWVSAQRQQKKLMESAAAEAQAIKSTPLTPDRINLLNEIGFTWTIRSRDSLGESWNQRLAELKAYKEEHGNCLVPSRYLPNPELGIWVGTQRTQYRLYRKAKDAGKSTSNSAMNEDRIAQLEALGFVWALRGGSDAVWKKRISELVAYRSAHGDTAVSSNYSGNRKLASWAAAVRAQYRLMQEGKPCTLDDEKIAELDSLQFPWDEPNAEAAGEDIVDSEAVAGALAAAADMSNEAPTELDVQMMSGEQGSNEVTAEDILNVAEL